MGEEYRAKVFKSGNSLALRLPKALGLEEGVEMRLRNDDGKLTLERLDTEPRKIDV
ncbi:AbrB/MazE/SpoVT family DNA-binding domain-containing protein, partial [Sphingobium sp.]|uniref:AbrB/MazE/SpoVT family DNA-binding domain-containing protein n=1 Tax=Sphingobium sp. TaxID=1912891 RepID=UPI002CC97BE3|nr:AbrB/MazE/SpoVT family DNA-binding domain-containing protein [Sphingobium sp.]